jgi:hypothetical protein
MKKLAALSVLVLAVTATSSFARTPLFGLRGAALGQAQPTPVAQAPLLAPEPVPATSGPIVGGPMVSGPIVTSVGPAIPLYTNVRYEDERKVDNCFVPQIVEIQDPCWKPCGCDCTPRCVAVQICVPPCCEPKICCSKDGRKVEYDYGKFEVTITTRRSGLVVVDYD